MTKGSAIHLAANAVAKCILTIIFTFAALGAPAQVQQSFSSFDRLGVGLSVGTPGIGLEFSTPVCSWARVRAGASFMPSFNVPMTFGLSSYVDGQGVVPINDRFDHINDILHDFTGLTINREVGMNAKATMVNASVIVDFYPLRNKHFYVSAGFYWGTRKIGHIENDIREMPTLMGLLVYNNLYDYFINERYIDEPLYNDVYLDPEVGDQMRDKFAAYGVLGAHVGDFKADGEAYMMEPDEDGVIEANMYVNSFKPYFGLGYECYLSRDRRWSFGVDAGMWFWGGAPDIITHEGVNMVKDLTNLHGKVGSYVDVASKLKVYPAINLTLRYNISLTKSRPEIEIVL